MLNTVSLCPVCYREIPAVIHVEKNVIMTKTCREHGVFQSIVERDPDWFLKCRNLNSGIYDGYLIDVTSKCNIKCGYCFHDNNGIERSVDEIYQEAEARKDLAPFILTGGEPTTHKDLPEIIRRLSALGEVNLLTNGINLTEDYLEELLSAGLRNETGIANISLSLHKESDGKDIEFLELCKKKGIKIWTVLYVIDDLSKIDGALELFTYYADTVSNFRIKAASNLWNEQKAESKIFTSDMLKHIVSLGHTELQKGAQKVSYAQILHRGLDVKLISWYDVHNVDLWDIDCAPYYSAKNGTVNNLVTSCLINEGIEKMNGLNIRRAYPCDIPKCGILWREGALETREAKDPNIELWCCQALEFIQSDRNHLYIAELKGEIVGFVSGYWTFDPLTSEKYIIGTGFYLKPEYRKSGIAQAMQDYYIQVGRKLGITYSERQVTLEHSKYLLEKGQKIVRVVIEQAI